MSSGTPTPKLGLNIYTNTDDIDYNEINADNLAIDSKLTVLSVTTATRPTGAERFDRRVILDTDINRYLKWSDANNGWETVSYNFPMSPVIPLGIGAAGVTINSIEFYQNNGVAQFYMNWERNTAIAAGNIANFTVATFPTPWVPRITTSVGAGGNGPLASYYLNTAGALVLCAIADPVPAGTSLSAGGTFLLS